MNKQSGAVSLFVVVFFMLLVTVVTVSFLRLMVADQQQASNNDLSASAYDSAQAGVEDAKRKLLEYKNYCAVNTEASCTLASDATHLSSEVCNAALVNNVGVVATSKTNEVLVQQSTSTNDVLLDQAYTCVTMKLNTEDYVGSMAANKSQMVPLTSMSAFNRVRVEWFSKEDVTTSGSGTTVNLTGANASGQPLYAQGQWPLNRPSLMRAQLMQVPGSGGFTLASFDNVSGANSNGATMFLYPTSIPGTPELAMTTYDQRKTDPADDPNPKDPLMTPTAITCASNLNAGGYACSSTLVLPQAVGATTDANRSAFLRLTSFYNATHFRVTLWNGPIGATSVAVNFKGVQPLIDSTGRANDLFRRVQSRVDLFDTTFPYPEAAIDLTGNFCKDFAVTDSQYIAGSTACTP